MRRESSTEEPVRVTHLSPAGDAGLDRVAQAVEGDFLLQFLDEFRAFRARSDEAHFPFEHVPQLGQFVDAGLRMIFPTLVTRGSDFMAQTAPFFSASVRMERNL